MASEGQTVIAVERVTKTFGPVVAVDDVSLDIKQGEFFSMLGPSGCGKTTTLRMIAGFLTPTSGRILLEGRDVSHVPPYRRNVNMVFQHYALFPHMSVFENVAFGPRAQRVSRKEIATRVMDALRIVRLDEFAKRRPSELSGGQQQRVALARALVNYPSALLLDEPLGALDLKLRQAMQLELKRIQREVGITFVYVTHDQEEALTMSDRIAVMNEGRVEQLGTPEEIYDRPASPFVAGFIGMANLLPATVTEVDGSLVTLTLPVGGRTQASLGDNNLHTGDEALLVLRPERLAISPQEPDSPETGYVKARIKDLVFQGPILRVAMECADGREIVIVTLPQNRPSEVGAGDEVWVTWPVQDGYVLPAGSAWSEPVTGSLDSR